MSNLDKHNRRPLHVVGAIGLLTVTVVAALSQGGVLFPRFRGSGSGSSESSTGSSFSESMENVSPRSWTITGVHLVDHAAQKLPDVRITGLGVQPEDFTPSLSTKTPGPSQRLTVSPGQYFNVSLFEEQNDCPSQSPVHCLNESLRLEGSPQNHEHSIPAAITVVTPLGTRSIDTTFSVSCGL
jgi:hypothetical protein